MAIHLPTATELVVTNVTIGVVTQSQVVAALSLVGTVSTTSIVLLVASAIPMVPVKKPVSVLPTMTVLPTTSVTTEQAVFLREVTLLVLATLLAQVVPTAKNHLESASVAGHVTTTLVLPT